ncbi:hypothetical protein C8R47DRAFT_1268091 [Mycena vitilis]|nr:hypothetical protein C8R47DRAFT_1268091 [Mycena vitilis]
MEEDITPKIPDTVSAANIDVCIVTTKKLFRGSVVKAMMPGADKHRQETVLTVVGASKAYDLPPVKKSDISASRVQYARQHATIIGYENGDFRKSLAAIQDIGYKLVTSVPDRQMEPWVPDVESEEFGARLGANCRYFTVGRGIPTDGRMDFDKYVDPAGVLKGYIGERVAHCMDNSVVYAELKLSKLVKKDLATFHEGDIVQLGFAVIAYQTQWKSDNPKYVCKLVMRTLTLVDNTMSKSKQMALAFNKRHKPNQKEIKALSHLSTAANPVAKRNKVYEEDSSSEDDIDEARGRFSRMHLDGTSGRGGKSTE